MPQPPVVVRVAGTHRRCQPGPAGWPLRLGPALPDALAGPLF